MARPIWYVYELVDPRCGSVFYIGKGKGSRVEQHEKDAANPKTVCSKKISKIKDIWSEGFQVQRRFNAMFWDEQAAYDHETDLIEDVGLHNLTNILPGGQKAWVERQRVRRVSRQAAVKPFDIFEFLKLKDERIYAMFRNWFALGMNKGAVKLEVKPPEMQHGKIYAAITESFYNSLLPMLWRHIKQDESAFAAFAIRMKPYNVELSYGGA